MYALYQVLRDQNMCITVMEELGYRAPDFIGSIEALVAHPDEHTRKWALKSFAAGLPVFHRHGLLPEAKAWKTGMQSASMGGVNPIPFIFKNVKLEESNKTVQFSPRNVDTSALYSPQNAQTTVGPSSSKSRPSMFSFGTKKSLSTKSKKNKLSRAGSRKNLVAGSLVQGMQEVDKKRGLQDKGGKSKRNPLSVATSDVLDEVSQKATTEVGSLLAFLLLPRLLFVEENVENGLTHTDLQVMFGFLVHGNEDPLDEGVLDESEEVETFGAAIRMPLIIPIIITALVVAQNSKVRKTGLKQLSVLLLKNDDAVHHFFSLNDWQSCIFPLFYHVPEDKFFRTDDHFEIMQHSMHLMSTLHVSVFDLDSLEKHGPIDTLLSKTMYKLAVYSGWTLNTLNVARSMLLSILLRLIKASQASQAAWRHDPSKEAQWESLFRMMEFVLNFMFYRPEEEIKDLTPPGSRSGSRNNSKSSNPPSRRASALSMMNLGLLTSKEKYDWRDRIQFDPVLAKVGVDCWG